MIPRILEGRLLRGPNVHYGATVFVMRVDAGLLGGVRADDAGAEFGARFRDRFAGVPCPPHATILDCLLEAVLAVERFVGAMMGRSDVPGFARLVQTRRGVDLVWEARAAWISRAAARVALAGLLELLPAHLGGVGGTRKTFDQRMARLIRQARRRQWTPAAAALVKAATDQQLPHELLAGSYVRLGEGIRQQVVSASAVGDAGAEGFLETLFPFGARATIPVLLVVGEHGTGYVAKALDRWLRTTRPGVGLALKDRITIQGGAIDPTAVGRRRGVAVLLGDPRVATAIGAVSPRSIMARGLGVERMDIAVLADPTKGDDRVAYQGALRVLLSARPTMLVLTTNNPFAESIARVTQSPEQVILVSRGESPFADAHAAAGGFVVRTVGRSYAGLVELRRGTETVGAMPLVWPGMKARSSPSEKALSRALLGAGAAFAVDMTGESPIRPPRMPLASTSLSASAVSI
jgi:hypothetical protein